MKIYLNNQSGGGKIKERFCLEVKREDWGKIWWTEFKKDKKLHRFGEHNLKIKSEIRPQETPLNFV